MVRFTYTNRYPRDANSTVRYKVLEVIDLTLCRGARPVLSGLHFAVAPGRCLQVLGANGSGKTTLLRALCGLLEIDGGAFRWKGGPVEPRSPEFQKELVYLGHDPVRCVSAWH